MSRDSIAPLYYRFAGSAKVLGLPGARLAKPRDPILRPAHDSPEQEQRRRNSPSGSVIPHPRYASSRKDYGRRKSCEQHPSEELRGVALKRRINPHHGNAEKRGACDGPRHHSEGGAIARTIDD